jgi:hypothetical protein
VTHTTPDRKAALNWANVVELVVRVALGQALSTREKAGSQPVDKVVDRTRATARDPAMK